MQKGQKRGVILTTLSEKASCFRVGIEAFVQNAVINPTEENLLAAQAHVLSLAENAQSVAAQLSEWNQNFLDYVAESCLQLCV